MVRHWVGIAAATVVTVLITLRPFMPGDFDPLAVPLSMLTRVFGFVGLLLVPVGALRTACRWHPSLARQRVLRVATVITLSIVAGLLSLAAFALSGWTLALITGTLLGHAVVAVSRRLSNLGVESSRSATASGLYMVIVPLAVCGLQQVLVPRAVEFSRDRAIRHAAPLITSIERYRASYGRYPPSLLSVWRDYPVSVIGIDRYQYEPHGEAYNLVFEQPALAFGTREFVVYNPRDEQVATSHLMDLLEFPPDRLERARGY